MRTTTPTHKSRPTVTSGADSRTNQQNPATTHSLATPADNARRLADAQLVRNSLRNHLIGMRAGQDPNYPLTIADVEKKVLDAEIEYAQAYVADLLTRHGITDRDQAHRLRERCTDAELFMYRACLGLLDDQGVLG